MNPFEMLHDYRTGNAIGRDDIATAAMLVEMARRDGAKEPQPLAWVAFCLALRTVRDGHTCVDLDRIGEWAGEIDPTAVKFRVLFFDLVDGHRIARGDLVMELRRREGVELTVSGQDVLALERVDAVGDDVVHEISGDVGAGQELSRQLLRRGGQLRPRAAFLPA